MKKVTVKLIDRGSVFHDPSQSKSVFGGEEVTLKRNQKVSKALRSNILEEVKNPKKESKAPTEKETYVMQLTELGYENLEELSLEELKSLLDESKGDEGGDQSKAYETMKNSELKEELDKRKIEYKGNYSNATLIELLTEDDSK